MKKAILVEASVMTRVIIDVNEEEYNKNNGLTEKDIEKAILYSKDNLLYNLSHDFHDCITDVVEDTEVPFEEYLDISMNPFKVNNLAIITRDDYETLPCPLCTKEFSNDKMQRLAELIYNSLVSKYGEIDVENYFNNCLLRYKFDIINNTYWRDMEDIAIEMGMRYYEDLTDEEYNAIISK